VDRPQPSSSLPLLLRLQGLSFLENRIIAQSSFGLLLATTHEGKGNSHENQSKVKAGAGGVSAHSR